MSRNLPHRAFYVGSIIYLFAGCGGSAVAPQGSPPDHQEGDARASSDDAPSGNDDATGAPDARADATSNDHPDAKIPPGQCDASPGIPEGRPEAVACPMTDITGYVADAGAITCAVDADCQDAGIRRWCRGGTCRPDQCLTDTDCGAGLVCACASMLRGNAFHTNACMESSCRVDADCGAGGVCSPSYSSSCSSFSGYYCHSAADSCQSNADCCGNTPVCRYEAPLGHWACAAVTVCSG